MTLVAYKRNGTEISMGCTTGHFDSDFIFEPELTRVKLIDRLADIMFANRIKDSQDSYYEIHVYADGQWHSQDSFSLQTLMTDALPKANELQIAHNKKLEADKQAEAAAILKDKENKERAEFERLKGKYA
jgi:hypothetical protein